jgi:alpha-tubulin suppressor-like RCC1 family protein
MRQIRMLVLGVLAACTGTALLAAPTFAAIVGWGVDYRDQLGTGYTMTEPQFSIFPVSGPNTPEGVKQVVVSKASGYALLEDGTVRSWGNDEWGQLGEGMKRRNGDRSYVPVPVCTVEIAELPCPPEDYLKGVKEVAASGSHAMALLENGTVKTWGDSAAGELGNGTTCENKQEPEKCSSVIPVTVKLPGAAMSIAQRGPDDAAIVSVSGEDLLFTWGENKYGQLGDKTTKEKNVPVAAVLPPGARSVKAATIGGNFLDQVSMLALVEQTNGTVIVMAAGKNKWGQLGNGSEKNSSELTKVLTKNSKGEEAPLSGVKEVSTSGAQSMALLENGKVLAWGLNTDGRLGQGMQDGPEKCGGLKQIQCSKFPQPVCAESVRTGETCPEGPYLENVAQIVAGSGFGLALRGSGELLSWGKDDRGQLDNGTFTTEGGEPRYTVPAPVHQLSNVTAISANTDDEEEAVLALTTEKEPPMPNLEVIPGKHSLTAKWFWEPREVENRWEEEKWKVAWRKESGIDIKEKWTQLKEQLPPEQHEITITELEAKPYEVRISNFLPGHAEDRNPWEFGNRVAIATPEE